MVYEYFKRSIVKGGAEQDYRGKHYESNGEFGLGALVLDDTSGLRQRVHNPKNNTCTILFKVGINNIIQSWSHEGKDEGVLNFV